MTSEDAIGDAPGRRAMTRILIVDDDPELLRLPSLRLKSEGFDVTEASSGERAWMREPIGLARAID